MNQIPVDRMNLLPFEEPRARVPQISDRERKINRLALAFLPSTDDDDPDISMLFTEVFNLCEKGKWSKIEANANDLTALTDQLGQSLLVRALDINNEPMALSLLARGIAIHTEDREGNTALHHACKKGYVDLLENFTKHISLEKRNGRGETPLHIAIRSNQERVVRKLLLIGANLYALFNESETVAFTPLFLAARWGAISCFKQLLERNPHDLTGKAKGVGTLLHVTVTYQQKEVLEYLFQTHRDTMSTILEEQDERRVTAFLQATSTGYTQGMLILRNNGASLNARDAEGRGPLHCAAINDDLAAVELLIALGAAPDAADSSGYTPIGLIPDEQPREPEVRSSLRNRLSNYAKSLKITDPILERIQRGDPLVDLVGKVNFDMAGAINLSTEKKKELYRSCVALIPLLNEELFSRLTGSSMQNLSAHSTSFAKEQAALARVIGDWYQIHQHNFTRAMNYYCIGIAIADAYHLDELREELERLASAMFVSFCYPDDTSFKKSIQQRINSMTESEEEKNYTFLSLLNAFSSNAQESNRLYGKIQIYLGNAPQRDLLKRFQRYKRLFESWDKASVDSCAIRRYRSALRAFRATFTPVKTNPAEARAHQAKISLALRDLFRLLLDDAFALIGFPPCSYDLRVLGAEGREEMTPHSPLELAILMENGDEQNRQYFQKLYNILCLQIASLGELIDESTPIFKAIERARLFGLRIEETDPWCTAIGTPKMLASQSLDTEYIFETCLLFQSISIAPVDADGQLFKSYSEAALPVMRRATRNGHARLIARVQAFEAYWKDSFPPISGTLAIKVQFEQFLNGILSDLAMCFNIPYHNSLNIVDELARPNKDGKVRLAPISAYLLRRSLVSLYALQTRLEKDSPLELSQELSKLPCSKLSTTEYEMLQSTYFLVLKPLYQLLKDSRRLDYKCIDDLFNLFDLTKLIDLHQVSSEENLLVVTTLVRLVATWFSEQAPTYEEEIATFYQKIGEVAVSDESLRELYIATLQDGRVECASRLLAIPNKRGERLSTIRNRKCFLHSIEELTQATATFATDSFEVKITTATRKARYLKINANTRAIFKDDGMFKRTEGSLHDVFCVTVDDHSLYLKSFPTHPLMEWGINHFTSLLGDPTTPESELVKFEVITASGAKQTYPVLLSRTIAGHTLKEAQSTLQWGDCDQRQWTWLFLATLLTRPGDGHSKNYVVTKDQKAKAFSVDNDVSFAEPIVAKSALEAFASFRVKTVQFASALFCLFPDVALDHDVLEEFCGLDPYSLLLTWMDDLFRKETEYKGLFKEDERKELFEKDLEKKFKPSILLREGTIATVAFQFLKLQAFIREKLATAITPLELMSQIVYMRSDGVVERVGEYVAKEYRRYFLSKGDADDKLGQVTGKDRRKSTTPAEADRACLGKIPTLGEIEKGQEFSLEEARKELTGFLFHRMGNRLHHGKDQIDGNFEGLAEIKQKIVLKVLQEWVRGCKEKPSKITLQHCTVLGLEELRSLLHGGMSYLDLRYCSRINDGHIKTIARLCPQLKELRLSGCSGLEKLTPELFKVSVMYLNNCHNLQVVDIKTPLLANLEVNNCAKLEKVKVAIFNPDSLEINQHGAMVFIEKAQIDHFEWFRGASHQSLKADREIILAAVKHDGHALQHADGTLKRDIDVVMTAVSKNGITLSHAHDTLKKDRNVVMAAVTQDGSALQYADDTLKRDRGIVMNAIKKKGSSFEYADDTFKKNKEFVLAAVSLMGSIPEFLGENLKKDNGMILQYANETLKRDKDFVLAAVSLNEYTFQYADISLKRDKDFVLAAVRLNEYAFRFADETLKRDRDFVIQAVSLCGEVHWSMQTKL